MVNNYSQLYQNSFMSDKSISYSYNKSSITNEIKDIYDSIYLDNKSYDNKSYNKFIENMKEVKMKKFSTYCDINDHFICKNCKYVPIINFVSFQEIEYSCSCYKVNRISINQIMNETIIKEKEANEIEKESKKDKSRELFITTEKYLKCQKHMKSFLYYCKTCEENICRECLRERYFHQYHNIFFFDLYLYEMDYKIGQLEKILLNDIKDLNFEFDMVENLIYLLSVIVKDYLLYPNYSHFLIIINASQFLGNYIINRNNNNIIEKFELKKEIIIMKKKSFYENILNPEIVTEIHINKSNFSDIAKVCELNFINLKKLILIENNIVNIKPLKYANFKNIEYISFQFNKLNDSNIPCLLELDFPKLIELDLYSNNFTKYELYELKNNKKYLPNLESLQIGANQIDWKRYKNNDIKFNFDTIKSFGLTNGVFDSDSISIIENFCFNKLEKIYLSRNNLYSLSFIENLKATNLKEIYLHTCFLKELYQLKQFKKLQRIYIYDNYISEIDKLEAFVDDLPDLFVLNISGNNISLNEKNQKILKSIKNKREKLNIMV